MVKFKNRYLLIEYQCNSANKTIDESGIYHSLIEVIGHLHGDYGISIVKGSLNIKVFNEETRILLVRVPRDGYDVVASSIPFVTKLGKGEPGFLRTIHMGGSIRSCEKALLEYDRREMHKCLLFTDNVNDRIKIQQNIVQSIRAENTGK